MTWREDYGGKDEGGASKDMKSKCHVRRFSSVCNWAGFHSLAASVSFYYTLASASYNK